MSARLYSVTLTDLGTYTVTVAAETPADAESIAKTTLFEEAGKLPDGVTILKREADAKAEPAAEQPVRTFDVIATYSIEFSIRVPAADRGDAERYARRIYQDHAFPFEYATGDENVRWYGAREVLS